MKSCTDSQFNRAAVSPSARREWIEMVSEGIRPSTFVSPSARREWIEIPGALSIKICDKVSLREEGVD